MLVCHCERVHCREIERHVREGAACAEEVAQRCGAGTGCGGCKPLVERVVTRAMLLRTPKTNAA